MLSNEFREALKDILERKIFQQRKLRERVWHVEAKMGGWMGWERGG